jgi:hypothetical protein
VGEGREEEGGDEDEPFTLDQAEEGGSDFGGNGFVA